MNQKEVFAKIGGIIKELNDQYAYLQSETENLNSLELELFVSNARFLTDHIEILAKLNSQYGHIPHVSPAPETRPQQKEPAPAPRETPPVVEEKKPEQVINPEEQPVPHIDLGEAGSTDSYSYMRQEPETIRHELVLDESINWEDGDEELEEDNQAPKISNGRAQAAVPDKTEKTTPPEPEKTDAVKEQPKPRAAARANEDVVTINQKMSSQLSGKASTGQTADAPVTDIKQAITLNDKLLFIKDLFNGYSLAYSEAVEILNRFKAYEEATTFLNKNYAVKNNWESKPETVEKFYSVLRRRYS